jgi:hypothetical protein
MKTKIDFVVSGKHDILDNLQAHATLIQKFTDGSFFNITKVSRSEDKSQLFVRIEDEAAKAERFKNLIRYRFPGLRAMMVRISKTIDNDGK